MHGGDFRIFSCGISRLRSRTNFCVGLLPYCVCDLLPDPLLLHGELFLLTPQL